jgi:Carboxypeptidase regulatory-like domain/TonB dependent receptor
MKIFRATLLFVLGLTVSFNLCQAQSSFGTIVGVVHDQSGSAVNNAPIQILNTATNVVTAVRTQPDGNYTAINLIPGLYVVSADVQGFAKVATTPTQLVVNQTLRIDLVLNPGAVTQTVQVTAEGALIDTDSNAVSAEISNMQVTDLPLVSRNFLNLTILSPGVVADPNGVIGGDQSAYRSTLSGGNIYVGGGRGSSNGYLIDGVDDNDPGFQTPTVTPPIDAIQDFRLMNKTYSAEYGGSAAQINVATKSGTNDFHGSVYEFLRNDAMDAINAFSVKDPVTGRYKPVLRYNQFGAGIGGPVWIPHVIDGRNKLFFFGAYEGTRSHTLSSGLGIFPTAAELSGDFSADATTIYDPSTGLPFPGNKITTINPQAQALIAAGLFPAPNTTALPGLNVVRTLSTPDDIDQYMIRVDAHLGPKNSLFARYSQSNEDSASPNVAPLGGTTQQQAGKNIAGDYTHIFTSNLINDLRFGLNRPITHQQQDGANTDNVASIFTGVETDPATWGAPYTALNGYSVAGGNTNGPLNYFTTDIKLSDMVTWIHGPHTVQAGVDVGKLRFKEVNSYLGRGLLFFLGYYSANPANPFDGSGSSVADFLLGDSYEALVYQGNYTGWYNSWGEGGFVQDNWKLSKKLTLNLGVRYDYQAPLKEEQNRVSIVDANYPGGRILTPNQAAVTATNSPLVAYTGARDIVRPTKNEWQPRVGLSYRPVGNTVIRAGYGIYYDSVEFNEYVFPVLNAPFGNTAALIGGLATNPVNLETLFPVSETSAPIAGTIGALTLNHDSQQPYAQQWNFGLQHELPGNMVMEVGYIGSAGTHLQDRRNLAQGQLSNPGPNAVIKFPYYNFASILLSENRASSNYNALIARFQKNFSHGYSLLANYTWSKALGTASALGDLGTGNASGYQNSWDPRADYGPLGYDLKHNFVLSPIWELPFGRGKAIASDAPAVANALIGGWQAQGIFTAHTGYPFSILANDNSGTNGNGSPRASLVGGQNPYASTPGYAFNINAFQQPSVGTFGNSGNNMMRGVGLNNTDLSLIKNTMIHESFGFQLRFEAFNVFNQRDLGPFPGVSLNTPSIFGIYSSIQHQARILQVALKINF